jgi:hypothetical protein
MHVEILQATLVGSRGAENISRESTLSYSLTTGILSMHCAENQNLASISCGFEYLAAGAVVLFVTVMPAQQPLLRWRSGAA